jgi:hypothetical protein
MENDLQTIKQQFKKAAMTPSSAIAKLEHKKENPEEYSIPKTKYLGFLLKLEYTIRVAKLLTLTAPHSVDARLCNQHFKVVKEIFNLDTKEFQTDFQDVMAYQHFVRTIADSKIRSISQKIKIIKR